MDHETLSTLRPPTKLDYSLTGESAVRAIERGLAEAEWYQTPVPRTTMRRLLERRNGPAIRDTIVWLGLILAAGCATWVLWPSWWAAIPYLIYATLYASTSDSRWHEAGHGTAFRTDWMNNALYEIASFMVMRESTVWRWSHTRHHSDTIIVGRDPEIAVPRPPDLWAIFKSFFGLPVYPGYFRQIVLHSFGQMSAHEKTFIPESEFPKVFRKARLYVAIYAAAIGLAICLQSILPLLYVGLPHVFGTWLMLIYGLTQHTGLAENVLDHRLNCRTVRMNAINRFLYWNMNYHVEHHMFPLVPYHALPQLHEAVKHDMPPPYTSLWDAWREIVPAVLKQVKDPAAHVKRVLPGKPAPVGDVCPVSEAEPNAEGWIEVCAAADLGREDVIRFDHRRKSYALVRDARGGLHAMDGFCTHGNVHLAGGWVKGGFIECPKHNGRFLLADGSPARAPICRGLATYPLEERAGRLWLNLAQAGGSGAREHKSVSLRVVNTRNVSTFIREIEVEPVDARLRVAFTPGDYLQVDIPAYDEIHFRDFDIPEPYASVWRTQHVFDLVGRNRETTRRNNYSVASNARHERVLRFNVRIATPPPGQDCPPGVGSAYMFSLKPGDTISAIGPFGDFHLKPTQKEMVYIGGGAGMAPLRAHLSHLFETEQTKRRVSFWYGARSKQELFYDDYFRGLEAAHRNFSFHVALSSPLATDNWTGLTGFIHEIVLDEYLRGHRDPTAVEYYLCGPPMMIKAVTKMLGALGVPALQIAFDEF
jgi:fatty acid desaturase/NAD(P)H-flavin reductase/nitrite reductase/ring-hydroxylating ferredoxin subunit